jgi:hypothetical protein
VLELIDARDTLLVQFRPDGRVLAYHSQYDLAQDYELALTLAIYETLGQPSDADGPAPFVNEPYEATPASLEWKRRQYVVLETSVRAVGAWLTVQGLAFIALLIPFIQQTMRIPSNRSVGSWLIFGAVLLLGATTSAVGVGAFLQRPRARVAGLVACAIGTIVFLLISFELFRSGLRRIGPNEIVILLAPAFAIGYVIAFASLWRWRRQ